MRLGLLLFGLFVDDLALLRFADFGFGLIGTWRARVGFPGPLDGTASVKCSSLTVMVIRPPAVSDTRIR